ncbi:pseudouridine synthase, partial [Stenotrophomonas maltophilia]
VVVPFEHHIIYEDQTLLVVDKPHFLTVSPAGGYVQQTLLTRLKQTTGNPHLSPVHRLDKQTAGLMIFTKTCESRRAY